MKLRLGAAVLLAALAPFTAVTAPAANAGGVDITPPAVGSCHDLTYDEAGAQSDADAPVPCSSAHTSLTIQVSTYDSPPDWDDGKVWRKAAVACYKAKLEQFGYRIKVVQMSAYTVWLFRPTKAQRDAGAAWIRCDLSLQAGRHLKRLSRDPGLGALPHPSRVARCRQGEAADFVLTTCDRPHRFRAKAAIKDSGFYPGNQRLKDWTLLNCNRKVGRTNLALYEWPSQWEWLAGLRYSICYTRS